MRRVCFLIGFLIGAAIVVVGAGRAVSGFMADQSAKVAERTTLPGSDR